MEKKQIAGIAGLVVIGSVITAMTFMAIKDELVQRKAIMDFAAASGVSYKEAKRIIKAYQKAPSPQAAVDLFGDMAKTMFVQM